MTTDLEAQFDFMVRQGDKWGRWFIVKNDDDTPVDLTGLALKMQLRRSVDADVAVELSTDNSRLVNGGVLGAITLNALKVVTEGVAPGIYEYSIRLYAAGEPTTLIVGKITVKPSVTR